MSETTGFDPLPVVEAVTILEACGVIDYNGHASFRLGDDRFAINSGASNRAAMGAADVVVMDERGEVAPGTPTAPREHPLHTAIYAARPDAGAVVHAHAPWATLLSTCSMPYEPVYAQGALLGAVPLYGRSASINTPALGIAVAEALGPCRALLLQSHGVAVCGATLKEAAVLTIYLEENARRQILARQAGGYRRLDPEEIADAASLDDAKLFAKCWAYFRAKSRLGA